MDSSEPREQFSFLQLIEEEIAQAREKIADELQRDRGYNPEGSIPRTWFGSFITRASNITGAYEMARFKGEIEGEKAERGFKNSKLLLDKIEQVRQDDTEGEINNSSGKQEEFIKMLDIFREE